MAAAETLVSPRYIRSEELGNEITELCGYIYAATYQLLVRIREFDDDKLWALEGICSCAHWLNYRCGIGINAAREKVRVANALADLPKISASFEKGELSYSKVRAMTRIATPENEDSLLMWAKHGTAHHIESLVSKYRKAIRSHEAKAANEQYEDRSLKWYYDEDGSLVIKGRLPAEQGAMIVKALECAMDDVTAETPNEDVTAETREPIAARRADGLMAMAESSLAEGLKSSSSADRYQVMLHVTAESLGDDVTAETPESHIEDGPHVTAETSRRVCCDSNVIPIKTDKNGEPLNIGRKSRTIPPSIRRALKVRDQGCRFPGCTHKHFIDGHHIRHWADGGETSLDNLVLLCRHHHRLVHEGGFDCEKTGNGEFVFRDPRGQLLGGANNVAQIMPNPLSQKRIQDRLEELHINAMTCVTRWEGDHMDYGLATELLWDRDFEDR